MSVQLIGGDPGKCRVCGCSELSPCLRQIAYGAPLAQCHWINRERTLCSNVLCIAVTQLDDLLAMQEANR